MNRTKSCRPLLAVAAWVACTSPWAAEPADGDAPASCVTVEVNGERVPAFDCLTRKLSPAAAPRAASGATPGLAAQRIAQRPAHELGQVNQAATQHRMGNGWGRGVTPQRPATPPPGVPRVPDGR